MKQVVTLVIVDPCVTVKHVVSGVVPGQSGGCMPQCFNFEWELESTPYNNKLFPRVKLGTSFYGWGSV